MNKIVDFFKSPWLRVAVIAAIMTVTVTVHYKGMSNPDPIIQALFRQFCYMPIMLAAIWFGFRGGIGAAAVIVLAVAPHLLRHLSHTSMLAQEGLEYFYYFLFGGLFGYLADRERSAARKREELARQMDRMEHLSALGELAAGLAHEIKNPMGSIKGAAEILAPEIPADHPKHEFVTILIEEVNRLNRVVDDFLKYARPVRLVKKRSGLKSLLEPVVTQLSISARGKDLEFALEVPEGLMVNGDEEKLRQVFLNLGLNALAAMSGSGRLRVRAESGSGELVIEFHDTGPGVAEDMRRKIFIPFVSGTERGTGLGLTISERIVIAHGGRVEVDTSPDGGALFRVVLPEGN
jgi:two-component system, NtrC family, sensor histidine kinase HydH